MSGCTHASSRFKWMCPDLHIVPMDVNRDSAKRMQALSEIRAANESNPTSFNADDLYVSFAKMISLSYSRDETKSRALDAIDTEDKFQAMIVYGIYGETDSHGSIDYLWCAMPLRRHGVAHSMLNRALSDMRAWGALSCSLWVGANNKTGREFYRHTGWQESSLTSRGYHLCKRSLLTLENI